MKTIIVANLILLLAGVASAQSSNHICHVYVVDVAKARKEIERETGTGPPDKEAPSSAETVFPEFRPVIGEEELTTKTYRFPRSRLTITASVYYTDESMASAQGYDSMLVGIVVSPGSQRNALIVENNTVSEVTLNNQLDTVRAKKYVTVNKRLYLIGIECRCKERKQ